MTSLQFTAIGTEWVILLDHELSQTQQTDLLEQLQTECARFDQLYSRFLPDSWLIGLSQTSGHSTHVLFAEAAEMFRFGQELESLTTGHFTLNIADELTALGYDATYSLQPSYDILKPKGKYWLDHNTLHLEGRVAFDLGAFGKGVLIDHLAAIILAEPYEHFLVDGSGDFFGTCKADGSAWTIGLQHPTDMDKFIGTFPLLQSGFASSGTLERHWPGGHHLLDGLSGQPTTNRHMAFVSAATACLADGLSTALFVSPDTVWSQLQASWTYEACILEDSADGVVFRRTSHFLGVLPGN